MILIPVEGQSNGKGTAKASNHPDIASVRMPNVFLVDNNVSWDYAALHMGSHVQNGSNHSPPVSDYLAFGCEAGLADRFKTNFGQYTKQPRTICKYNVGGTDLANDWDPDTGTHYSNALSQFNTTKSFLQTRFGTVIVPGFIWIQGEEDATNEAKANAYEANLTNFVSKVRTDYGVVKIVLVLLSTRMSYTYVSTVRTAQINVAANDSNIATVDPDTATAVTFMSDYANHYDGLATGQIELGKRVYDAAISIGMNL